jgi:four helix bundle protein
MSRNQYDLDKRTFNFAKDTRQFLRKAPKDVINFEDIKQLARSSGSVGANYIEANESFSERDFKFRLMICKKEAKESIYWLRLLYLKDKSDLEKERQLLIREADELTRIFASIIIKKSNSVKS